MIADFLNTFRPGGPWLLVAIHPDKKGSPSRSKMRRKPRRGQPNATKPTTSISASTRPPRR